MSVALLHQGPTWLLLLKNQWSGFVLVLFIIVRAPLLVKIQGFVDHVIVSRKHTWTHLIITVLDWTPRIRRLLLGTIASKNNASRRDSYMITIHWSSQWDSLVSTLSARLQSVHLILFFSSFFLGKLIKWNTLIYAYYIKFNQICKFSNISKFSNNGHRLIQTIITD